VILELSNETFFLSQDCQFLFTPGNQRDPVCAVSPLFPLLPLFLRRHIPQHTAELSLSARLCSFCFLAPHTEVLQQLYVFPFVRTIEGPTIDWLFSFLLGLRLVAGFPPTTRQVKLVFF